MSEGTFRKYVVPANAGTHNHRRSLVRKPSGIGLKTRGRGVWVPARAEPVIGRAFARPVGLAGTTRKRSGERYGVTGEPFGRAMPFSPAILRSRTGSSEMMPSTPISIIRAMSSGRFTVQTTT
jgi:hypothetical protein